MSLRLASFLLLTGCSLVSQVAAQQIEIQFAPIPLGKGGAPPKELLDLLLGGPVPGPGKGPSPVLGGLPHSEKDQPALRGGASGKEAQLDQLLQGFFGPPGPHGGSGHVHVSPGFGPLRGGPHPSPFGRPFPHGGPFGPMHGHFGGGPFPRGGPGFPPAVEVEVVEEVPFHGGPHSAFPAAMFRDLFPGPLAFDMQEEHPMPFDAPDPLVQSILKDLDPAFLGLMGGIQKAASVDRTPNSCSEDIKKQCEVAKSKLHCLGQHADDVSEACHKDIGKSVPFRCSDFIDKFCDMLDDGILTCLGKHISDLSDSCKDAVLATHHVISKANTQQVAVVDTQTGAKAVSEPHPLVTAPPSMEGAPPVHATTLELPKSLIDVLGVAQSISAYGNGAAYYKSLIFCITLVTVLVMLCLSSPTAWHKRKFRALFPSLASKEDECLLKGTGKVEGKIELPRPVELLLESS